MTVVPVYRFAKPKPTTDSAGIPLKKVQVPKTDSQGVPLKSKTQTSKTKQKMPSSTPVKPDPIPEYKPISTDPPSDDPFSSPNFQYTDDPVTEPFYGGQQIEESKPEQPFHVLEEQTFPMSEVGDVTSLLDHSSPFGFENGPHHFAEALGGPESVARPQSDRAERMRQIIEAAYNNPNGIKTRSHQQQVKDTDIPLGHARIGHLIHDHPLAGHIVKVHYPQGIVTTYRARLTPEGDGYR